MKGQSKMKRTVSCFVVLAVLSIVPSVLRAAVVLEVPEAYATVEAALAAAVKGDTVRVAPGEYMLADYAGITVPSGVTLEGTGNSPEDTVFKAYSATASDTTSASLLYVTNGIVRNLTFKGARCTEDETLQYRVLRAEDKALISGCVFTDAAVDPGTVKTPDGKWNYQGRLVSLTLQSRIEKSVIRNATYKNGKNYSLGGAGVVLSNSEMSECYVTNNTIRSISIGMVYMAGNSVLSKTVVAKNRLLSHEKFSGATPGIKVHSAGALIEDCIVENNHTENDTASSPQYDSAPIYLNAAATVRRTVVRNNTAYSACVGGVWVADGASVLENLLIYGNRITNPAAGTTTTWFYAGGLRIDTAGTKVLNCTVVGNSIATEVSRFRSHGIYLKNVAATVCNSIFFGNGPEGAVNFKVESNRTTPSATYCCSSTAMSGAGCINVDPLFVDPENEDYHLHEKSPCRNAGSSTVTGAPLDDLEGVTRPQESVHDIGCYEFVYSDVREVYFTQSTDVLPARGGVVSFRAYPSHVDEVLSHTWTVLDEDGKTVAQETVEGSDDWSFTFPAGYVKYTVKLDTRWLGDRTFSAENKTVQIALGEVYVSAEGGNVAPYDTWEKAAHSIADAVEAVYGNEPEYPGIVRLAPGVYTASSGGSADGAYLVSIAKSVRLVGTGETPEETVLDGEGTRRVLSLTGAGAGAENLVIARARTSSTSTTGTNIGYALNMVNAGTVDNCVISNAVTTGASEGCVEHWIYLNGGVITNSVIRDGNAGTAGRCVWVNKGSIGSSAIFGCVSRHKYAGVITVDGTASSLVDCDVYNNQDQMREFGYRCGTVAAGSGAKILNCRIFNNETTFNRSAHYLGIGINAASYYTNTSWKEDYGNVLIDGCVISNNTTSVGDVPNSSTKAAACGVLLGYKTVLRNSLIVNNSISQKNNAVYDYPVAGGVRTADSASYSAGASVENCTIAGNTSCVHQAAGGVYLLAGSIVNSISYGNGGQRKGQPWIDGDLLLSGDATAAYTLTKEEVAGEGNIAADPLLNDDYTFGRRSPALNAGIRQEWMKGALDLSGKARVYGDRVDLGCFELEIMQGFRVIVR